MNLLDSLKENNSVVLQQEANNWEEAIKVCMKPLLESNSIEEKYIENIRFEDIVFRFYEDRNLRLYKRDMRILKQIGFKDIENIKNLKI